MTKRNKDESLSELRKRVGQSEILDTSANDILLDVNAPDEDKTIEGLLRLEKNFTPSDNTTVSWRIPSEVMAWAKEVARNEGVKQNKDIHYQKLIMGCFLEKYPMPEEK